MLNLIWKILPGFLLGQWAAMMAYFLPAALAGRSLGDPQIWGYGSFIGFMVLGATAATPRKAWGRCLTATALILFAVPLMSTGLVTELERAGAEMATGPEEAAAVGAVAGLAGVMGIGFMFVFFFFLGACILVPGVYLLRRRPSSRYDAE